MGKDKILVNALYEQMPEGVKIFSASLKCNEFIIESENVDVSIYNCQGEDFAVVFSKDGSICEYVSCLLNNECIAAYTMLRNDVLKENKFIEVKEEEENIDLVLAFNNPTMNAETFEKILLEIDKSSKEFQKFKRKVAKIAA